jgi:hypothetical protein
MPARDYPLCMPVPHVKQRSPVWCWAACSEMLATHYGETIDQAVFAAKFQEKFSDSNESMASPQETAWLLKKNTSRKIETLMFKHPYTDLRPTWDAVCEALNRGQLIILNMHNHAVLIIGFGYSAVGLKPFLWINNPAESAANNPMQYGWEQVYAGMASLIMVSRDDIGVLD